MSERDRPNDAAAEMPKTRVERLEAVGKMSLKAGEQFLLNGAKQLLSGQGAEAALASGHRAAAAEVFDALGRMRGVAAKVGQLLAQSPSAMGEEYVERLLDLSHLVPPMMFGLIKTQIQAELGCHPSEAFATFDREPFASASLGQVHRARSHDGAELAVKVQYPGIADTMRADLANTKLLLRPVALAMNVANADEAFSELEERLSEELDYRLEARNLRDFRGAFAADPDFVIPSPADRSTRRVLIMDFVSGANVRDYMATHPSEADRRRYGELLLRFGWASMFEHGFLHVDPNPGNYLFSSSGKLGVVDFGCVKRLPEARVSALRRVVAAGRRGRTNEIEEAAIAAGMLAENAHPALRRAMAEGILLWAEPFRGGSFNFGDPTFLRRQLEARAEFRRVASEAHGLAMQRDWMFYSRYQSGVTHLLYRLGVEGDFSKVLERYA